MDAGRVRAVDVALAAVAAAALVVVMAGVSPDPGDRAFDALAGMLVVVIAGVLALHRRAPMLVLAVSTAALALYGLRDYPGGAVYLTVIVAVFALSLARGPVRAGVPAALTTAVLVVTTFEGSRGYEIALWISWAVAALLLGGSIRGRRAERAALEERARHLAETRDEEARRRVAEERVRIARDLHDSVAHSMASISVQAGVGAHVIDERPDDARAALLAIKDASRNALAELRATLNSLRSGGAAPREPAEGLDRLPALVESSRAAGLDVEVVMDGDAGTLPPAVDAAAYRVVQESLTNVIRHAGPARATVAVRRRDGGVEVEVTDDGWGAAGNGNGNGDGSADGDVDGDTAAGGGGHGLAGMRERVTLLGGELEAGPRRAGGFGVRARLPL